MSTCRISLVYLARLGCDRWSSGRIEKGYLHSIARQPFSHPYALCPLPFLSSMPMPMPIPIPMPPGISMRARTCCFFLLPSITRQADSRQYQHHDTYLPPTYHINHINHIPHHRTTTHINKLQPTQFYPTLTTYHTSNTPSLPMYPPPQPIPSPISTTSHYISLHLTNISLTSHCHYLLPLLQRPLPLLLPLPLNYPYPYLPPLNPCHSTPDPV